MIQQTFKSIAGLFVLGALLFGGCVGNYHDGAFFVGVEGVVAGLFWTAVGVSAAYMIFWLGVEFGED